MRTLIQKKSFLGLVALLFLIFSGCKEKEPIKPIINPVPLYRLFHPVSNDHFYTTSITEKNEHTNVHGYNYEGIACNVDTAQASGKVPFYQVWNNQARVHFYTTNLVEKNKALTIGFAHEEIACYVYEMSQPNTIPFYRLYSPTTNDHFYTTNLTERDKAIKDYGYIAEGIACYVFP